MFLFLLIFPFCVAVALCLASFLSEKNLWRLSVGASLVPLLLLLINYDHWIGETIEYPWLPHVSIAFHLSVDSLSLFFVMLTAVVVTISIFSMPTSGLKTPHFFYGLIFLLEGLLFGFFTARDLVVFTLFWEAMLLPLFFIIQLWGGEWRFAAALQFIVYMIGGSILMVAAVIALYVAAGAMTGNPSFDLDQLEKLSFHDPLSTIVFAIFLLAFAVKTPLFPFHAWLPDAYSEAPFTGTILLSAVLSKAGIYGFLRIGLGLFPDLAEQWSTLLLVLSIIGVFYGGILAWTQTDVKRLIAYSSFSHVNFILAGLFMGNALAYSGVVLQSFNHAITIAALFLAVEWLEKRIGSRSMNQASGLATYLPKLCWITLVFVLSAVALPGTNTFVGEIMILLGIFHQHPALASLLATSVILSVLYMLRWIQKVYFENPSPFQDNWKDLQGKEMSIALALIALIFWVGIYPAPLLQRIPSSQKTMIAERAP